MMPSSLTTGRALVALAASSLCAPIASAQLTSAPITNIRYQVTADRAALSERKLGVQTEFDVAGDSLVVLSLPEWTPGAYEVSDYAKWVSTFTATQNGKPLVWDKYDFDTWRVKPSGAGRVKVTFNYQADSLDNAMSWTKPDFALFNGTNLFMYAEGRPLQFASTVHVVTNESFRVVTPLRSTGRRPFADATVRSGETPKVSYEYSATNYHDLVDDPVFVGMFDLDSAIISGKTVRYATYPAGSVAGGIRAAAWDQLKRIIPVESAVFGETPWDNYTLMQIADSSYSGYSGLEHASSHVDVVSPQFFGSEQQPSLYAHEIFHSWNVKRLRPAELMPYAYDRRQPTRWLWVSEGITDYYADLAEVRSGVVDATGFYTLTAAKIGEIGTTVPFALEDASLNTWVHPRDGTEYSYYPKGSLAGLMLDIMIRDASENRKSLDTVMRELYESTYKKGRGFTHDDFWGSVSRAAGGKSFAQFDRDYVDGRVEYPWATLLPRIGLRLVPDSAPRIGITSGVDPAGAVRVLAIEPGSTAASAGIQPGDEIVSVGEIAINDNDFGAKFRLRYNGRPAGSPLPIVVKRGTQSLNLAGSLNYVSNAPRLAEDPSAPARAVRIREAILRGTTDK